MKVKTAVGPDGRTWSVRRGVEWRIPFAVEHEFEHDVSVGRYSSMVIPAFLGLFWGAVAYLYMGSMVHTPWYMFVIAALLLLFLPFRWLTRRPWTIVAETPGRGALPAEHWVGMVRGYGKARGEMRIAVRSIRVRATPGYGDSPLHPVN
jgi:hypothetical protein